MYYAAMVNAYAQDVNTLGHEFLRFIGVHQYVYYVAMINAYAQAMNTFGIPYMRYYRCMVKKT
ncbi:hypothetical protein ADT30_03050 [Xylella fastidiosa]|nr:hypothetical protein ADT30_03050 [Xylella fastidiosa]